MWWDFNACLNNFNTNFFFFFGVISDTSNYKKFSLHPSSFNFVVYVFFKKNKKNRGLCISFFLSFFWVYFVVYPVIDSSFFRESFNLQRLLLMIALYHQIKILIDFWCKQGLNSWIMNFLVDCFNLLRLL